MLIFDLHGGLFSLVTPSRAKKFICRRLQESRKLWSFGRREGKEVALARKSTILKRVVKSCLEAMWKSIVIQPCLREGIVTSKEEQDSNGRRHLK